MNVNIKKKIITLLVQKCHLYGIETFFHYVLIFLFTIPIVSNKHNKHFKIFTLK